MIIRLSKQCEHLPAWVNDWVAWTTMSKQIITLTELAVTHDKIEYVLHHELMHLILYDLGEEGAYCYDSVCDSKEWI